MADENKIETTEEDSSCSRDGQGSVPVVVIPPPPPSQ